MSIHCLKNHEEVIREGDKVGELSENVEVNVHKLWRGDKGQELEKEANKMHPLQVQDIVFVPHQIRSNHGSILFTSSFQVVEWHKYLDG